MKKKILLVTTAISMMAALAGCGSEGMTLKTEEATTTEVTTKATTEATTTEDITEADIDDITEEDIDDTTEIASYDGFEELNGVYFLVDDMSVFSTQGDTVVYANSDNTETIAITVLKDNGFTKDQIYQAYDEQIRKVYGENVETGSYVTADFIFDEYDYLNGNDLEPSADVKAYLYSDGKVTIYLEHGVPHGNAFTTAAEDLMDSIIVD